MSSLSVKRTNIDSNSFKVDFKSKYESNHGKKLSSTNNKSSSLKSKLFRLLFNVKDNEDDIDNILYDNDNTDDNISQTIDGLEVVDDENRECISSYNDIKEIFDQIDKKFGECQGGENWPQQYGNNLINNTLTNCEIQSPVKCIYNEYIYILIYNYQIHR